MKNTVIFILRKSHNYYILKLDVKTSSQVNLSTFF